MTEETKKAPSANLIDAFCIAFDQAKADVEKAQQDLSAAKGDLQPLVQDCGYVPSNAPKTLRLEGILYTADLTTPSTVEINEAAVAELQSELSRLKHPKVFKQLFDRQVKHSLRKDAAGTLKLAIGIRTEETQKRMLGLLASCFTVGTKAPSLTVDLTEALRAREAEKEQKAAAKAARAAKSKKAAKQ